MKRAWAKAGLGAMGVLGAGAVGVGAVAGWIMNGTRRPALPYAFSPFEVGAVAEDVRFRASDGVSLAGWWFDQPGAGVVVICAHGHGHGKAEMLGIGPGLWRAGFPVLLFDFRGNGASGDGPKSVAHYEQRDLRAAVEYVAARRPDATIAVVGFSMGASTALLTAATEPRIGVLVLDSPFATLSGVVANKLKGARALLPVVAAVNRIGYGYSLSDVRPIDAVADIPPRPLMLLHGTEDSVIPFAHAEALASAAGEDNVEFIAFPGVDHCGGYFEDRPGYIARVADFLRRSALPEPANGLLASRTRH